MSETTLDKLLGGRFLVEQPAKGYRIAVDTLLLASAIPAQAKARAIEFGCGVGGVMLALATRCSDVRITGIELQREMAALCQANIERNNFADRLNVIHSNLSALDATHDGLYDHVIMNPPYHDPKKHGVSATLSKKIANTESEDADLGLWIGQGARVLSEDGLLTMIHRADRQEEMTGLMKGYFSRIEIKPVIARHDMPPKRILIRAYKRAETEVRTLAPFVLYQEPGKYSATADLILREAQAMCFD